MSRSCEEGICMTVRFENIQKIFQSAEGEVEALKDALKLAEMLLSLTKEQLE